MKPSYKLQNDGSLIILTTDTTVPNHSRECGMCETENLNFWLVKKDSIKKLFSFSANISSPYRMVEYEYSVDNTIKEGAFYLNKDDVIGEEWQATFDQSYWKNNSTYVVRMASEKWFRDFYIHFDAINNVSRIEVGEMLKMKP